MEELKNNSVRKMHSDEQLLRKCQDLMLNTLEEMLPSDFDFSDLAKIFEDGQQTSPPHLLLQLLKYYIYCLSNNFISNKTYQLLQQQTQKLQSTIRSHIKIEQQMKMYLEYLQAKINKYQSQLLRIKSDQQPCDLTQQLELIKSRQTVLMKEKIIMLKQNQTLTRQLQQLKLQLKEPKSNYIKFIQPSQQTSIINIDKVKSHMRNKTTDENLFNNPQSYNHIQPLVIHNGDHQQGLHRINSQSINKQSINKRSYIMHQNNNQKSQLVHNYDSNRGRIESEVRKKHVQSYSQVGPQREIHHFGLNKMSKTNLIRPIDWELTQKKGIIYPKHQYMRINNL